jgi:hypothetical protein
MGLGSNRQNSGAANRRTAAYAGMTVMLAKTSVIPAQAGIQNIETGAGSEVGWVEHSEAQRITNWCQIYWVQPVTQTALRPCPT